MGEDAGEPGTGDTSEEILQGRRSVSILSGVAFVLLVVVGTTIMLNGCGHPRARRSTVPAPTTSSAEVPVSSTSTTTAVATTSTTLPALPPVVDHGTRDRPMLALTFDSNLTVAMIHELDTGAVTSFYNQAVIDELDAMRVPATLFLTGLWMERYPDATRRLAGDPLFELGSHSYSHRAFRLPCYGLGGLPIEAMSQDVQHSFEVLRRFTDHPTSYFRFPGGCYDQAALRAIAPTGVTVIQYDLPSGDAFGTSVPAIVHQTVDRAQNGSIIVMHLTGGNTAPLTDKALPQIVAGLRARGFQLVRVSDLLRSPSG